MQSPDSLARYDEPWADYLPKVTEAAIFAGDVDVLGILHGKILRSTVPHTRTRSIDATLALAMPGVVAVLTIDEYCFRREAPPVEGSNIFQRWHCDSGDVEKACGHPARIRNPCSYETKTK